jgi:GT2 family glycosyltransferase
MVQLPTNRGYAAACNAVAAIAIELETPFVWFLNNDVDMGPAVSKRLVAGLEADPSAAAIAPVTVDSGNGTTVLGGGAAVKTWLGKVTHLYVGCPIDSLPPTPYAVDAIEGAGPLVRVSALRDIGSWDEGFFMYWEDTEWSVRARRANRRLLVTPGATLRHAVSASSTPAARQRLMLRNRVRFVRIVAPMWAQPIFICYYSFLWLPAFFVMRLVPQFGFRQGGGIAIQSLAWNIKDAARRRRWKLRSSDQEMPALSDPSKTERR